MAESRGGYMDNNSINILGKLNKITIKVNVLALIRFARKIMKWRKRWLINHGKNV